MKSSRWHRSQLGHLSLQSELPDHVASSMRGLVLQGTTCPVLQASTSPWAPTQWDPTQAPTQAPMPWAPTPTMPWAPATTPWPPTWPLTATRVRAASQPLVSCGLPVMA